MCESGTPLAGYVGATGRGCLVRIGREPSEQPGSGGRVAALEVALGRARLDIEF